MAAIPASRGSARCSARAYRMVTASASSAAASAGVVASRSMHAAHGLSSMPRLRSMAQITTSRQAARFAISSLSPPLLPEPVAPPRMACRRRNSTRHGSASSNGPRSIGLGDRGDRRAAPRDRVGVRVTVQHPQFAAVGQVIGGRVDADRAALGAQARFDGGYLRGHVGDGLPTGQAQSGAPAPQVHHGVHDLRPVKSGVPGDVRPRRDGAFHADLRAPPAVGPPRDRQHQRADAERLRQRRGERAGHGGERDPRPARQHRYGRVEPFQPRGNAELRAEAASTHAAAPSRPGWPATTRQRGVGVPAQSPPRAAPRPGALARCGSATPTGR